MAYCRIVRRYLIGVMRVVLALPCKLRQPSRASDRMYHVFTPFLTPLSLRLWPHRLSEQR
jgi:hypothetical protein